METCGVCAPTQCDGGDAGACGGDARLSDLRNDFYQLDAVDGGLVAAADVVRGGGDGQSEQAVGIGRNAVDFNVVAGNGRGYVCAGHPAEAGVGDVEAARFAFAVDGRRFRGAGDGVGLTVVGLEIEADGVGEDR